MTASVSLLSLLLAASALGLSTPAAANGRFPRAQRLVALETEPERLALYGTYGLATTVDAGRSWQYICEGATGPFAGEAPLLELLPEGRIVLSSETGLRGSSFPACEWRGLLEPVLPSAVQDITRDPSDPSALWALISEPDVAVGYRSALAYSADAGEHWSEPVRIPIEVVGQGLTLDAAPSQPTRLYVSGLNADDQGALARSDDAGESWQAWPIAGTGGAAMPYIAGVATNDEDVIYVRSDVLADHDGELQPDDALFYSSNGGESFTRVLSRRAKLLGFALSPDGETLLLGYGDPVLFAYTVEPEQVGLYSLRTADLASDAAGAADTLEQIFSGSVTCLRWTGQGLHACVAQAEQGFEVGWAADADFTLAAPQPFEGLLDLTKLLPLSCAENTSAGACSTDTNWGWPFVCTKLGADCSPDQTEGARGAGGGCACRAGPRPARVGDFAWILGLLTVCGRRLVSRARRSVDTKAR